MGYHDLVLDRHVLLWVFIPLTCAVVLMMLLRQYVSKVRRRLSSLPRLRHAHALAVDIPRQRRTQTGSQRDTRSSCHRQKPEAPRPGRVDSAQCFHEEENAALFTRQWHTLSESRIQIAAGDIRHGSVHDGQHAEVAIDWTHSPGNARTDALPALSLHPVQIMMGAWVNYFFAGFILGRVPFSLSPRFRPMLQVRRIPGASRRFCCVEGHGHASTGCVLLHWTVLLHSVALRNARGLFAVLPERHHRRYAAHEASDEPHGQYGTGRRHAEGLCK